MIHGIDADKLRAMIISKRGNQGLRQTAKEIGISAPTLSRIENNKVPDLETYTKICSWLEVGYDQFSLSEKAPESIQTRVVASLRAEQNLSQKTVDSLITMINLAYKQIEAEGQQQ